MRVRALTSDTVRSSDEQGAGRATSKVHSDGASHLNDVRHACQAATRVGAHLRGQLSDGGSADVKTAILESVELAEY